MLLINASSNASTRNLPLINFNNTQSKETIILKDMGHLDGEYTRVQFKELNIDDLRLVARKSANSIKKTKDKAVARL